MTGVSRADLTDRQRRIRIVAYATLVFCAANVALVVPALTVDDGVALPAWVMIAMVAWSFFTAGTVSAFLFAIRLLELPPGRDSISEERQAVLDRFEEWADTRPATLKVALVLVPVVPMVVAGTWAAAFG